MSEFYLLFSDFEVYSNYLAIDNDWAVNVGADEGSAGGIEITFKRGSGIADGDAIVGEAGEFCCLEILNNIVEADHFCDLNFAFFLSNIDNFDFATAIFGSLFENCSEFGLFSLDTGA